MLVHPALVSLFFSFFFSTFTQVVSMIESEERNLSGGVELAVSELELGQGRRG